MPAGSTELGTIIPNIYREAQKFRVSSQAQEDIITRFSDKLLDWATGDTGIDGGEKIRFSYSPRILGSSSKHDGRSLDLRLAVLEPVYLLAGEMMDQVTAITDDEAQKPTTAYMVASGALGLMEGLLNVVDDNAKWGGVTKRVTENTTYLHMVSEMGSHRVIEIYTGVGLARIGIRYHQRNPAYAVDKNLPRITNRLGLNISSYDDNETGKKLTLELFAREDYWMPGQKPNTIILDISKKAVNLRRNFMAALVGKNNNLILATGDEDIINSMMRKFADDIGAGKIYGLPSTDNVKTLRQLREARRGN